MTFAEFIVIVVIFLGWKLYKWSIGNKFARMDKSDLNAISMMKDGMHGASPTQIQKNAIEGKYNKK